ncbi:hypothetical protein ACOMHN_003056 [Nucella lapillus]
MATNTPDSALGAETSTKLSTQGAGLSFIQLQAGFILWKVWTSFFSWELLGNIATIAVMARRIKDHNSSQHVLLMSLALSDLLLLYTGALREWLRYMFQVDMQSLHNVSCKLHSWTLLYSANVISFRLAGDQCDGAANHGGDLATQGQGALHGADDLGCRCCCGLH